MTTRPLPVQPQFKENAGSDDAPIKGDKKRGKRKQRKQGTPKHEDGDQVIFPSIAVKCSTFCDVCFGLFSDNFFLPLPLPVGYRLNMSAKTDF